MTAALRRESLVLFIGDIIFLVFSLWITLLVRYLSLPSMHLFWIHLVPFSILFLFSALVFLIAGLYEKHTLLMKSRLPQTIFYAQVANVLVGASLFFLVPYFGITPKTNLFLYLLFSTVIVSFWRLYLFPRLAVAEPQTALLVGDGDAADEVMREINGNTRYSVRFAERMSTHELPRLVAALERSGADVVVLPFSFRERLDATFPNIEFIDLEALYEELFDRVSLPLITERWFIEVNAQAPTRLYDAVKRITDMLLAGIALVLLSPVMLAVALALLGGGSPFIFQARVGKGGRTIRIIKFRTMLFDDGEDPEKKKKNRITRFGALLRKSQFDEVPQFWNVLVGDLSLIGPRPEIPRFVEEYAHAIPHYEARHLIQPGISGWAQIKHASPPKFQLDIEATKNKLAYDLFYLKHRSFLLDAVVILQTVKILIARASR